MLGKIHAECWEGFRQVRSETTQPTPKCGLEHSFTGAINGSRLPIHHALCLLNLLQVLFQNPFQLRQHLMGILIDFLHGFAGVLA
jgi:hypothetical protein